MQESFAFAAGDLAFIRETLTGRFGPPPTFRRREPVWQMVRAILGCRTQDADSEAALERLIARWPDPRLLAAAAPPDVERVIAGVNFADEKAANLVATLQWIGRERPDYDLSFLKTWSVFEALAWLQRFPGVGPKVAAATLNASKLGMRVFIVDCHVHRVLRRFGFIGPHATAENGRNAVTAAAGAFDAAGLFELFAQMKRLGQTLCRFGAPDCAACPLAARCSMASFRRRRAA